MKGAKCLTELLIFLSLVLHIVGETKIEINMHAGEIIRTQLLKLTLHACNIYIYIYMFQSLIDTLNSLN